MKVWMRLLYLAMAILLLLTAVPVAFAAQGQEEEEAPEDFVILLDCSMSLGSNDPKNLCLEACKNFVDKLPSQNARVTVIAFGYEDKNDKDGYIYSSRFEIEWQVDAKLIHVLSSFGDLNSIEAKTEYKDAMAHAINSNRENKDTYTPIGHALAAAVDVLERKSSADGKACVVLVSDGVNCPMTLYQDADLIDPASTIAGEHNWPIYCVQLNYNNGNKTEVEEANALLDRVCGNSGDRKVGRISCQTPEDVYIAFQRIFNDFYHPDAPEPTVLPIDLPGTYEFEVPALTSEATVDVFGTTIESVELINVDQGASIKIDKNVQTEDFIATEKIVAVVEENYYSSIKLICPDEGSWKVLINGDANATVLVSNTALQEMGLTMIANASTSEKVLTKTDTVDIHAYFSYMDYEEHKSSFYTENPASLKIYCSNGEVIEKTMDTAENGYFYTLSVSDVPVGSFEVAVELKHPMFRTGKKVSNSAVFKTKNLPIEVIKTEPLALDAFVNCTAPRIDLSEIFDNPDKDPVTYTFACASDRTLVFGYDEQSLEMGYLDINAGVVPGTYELEIGAQDPNMSEPVFYKFHMTVENRDPLLEKEVQVEQLWLDNWSWQTTGALSAELELNDYFSDPDHMPLSFTVSATDGEDGQIITAELSGSKLTLLPVNAGSSTVTVKCSDGLSEITGTFDVEVVSARAVYWKENGFFWLLGILIFIVIVLICLTMFFTTKVRGKWSISVTVNHKTASCNPIALTTCGKNCKKRKFSLLDLVKGAGRYLTTGDPTVKDSITDYFTTENGAEKIMIHGVALGNGFKIKGVPRKNSQISVTHDGRPITSGTIRGGNVQITLHRTSNTGASSAVIVLNCTKRK